MPFEPREAETLSKYLRVRLENRISGLTNWAGNSFNAVWVRAFSQGLRENEVRAVAAQLSGWIEYAGGPVTESDLRDLGIADTVSPEEVNEFMEDEDLDELVKIVGLSRSPGVRATGNITVNTSGTVTITPDEVFGTQPDNSGDFREFEPTDSDFNPLEDPIDVNDGDTVYIQATDIGEEYNVGSGTVTFMPSPPINLNSISNPSEIDGGVDRETNAELRERGKGAALTTTGGGTAQGVIGFLLEPPDPDDFDDLTYTLPLGVEDVVIEEFDQQQPPYVDVIVDGGADADVNNSIQFSKPVGIEHNLVRPNKFSVRVTIDVEGTDIDSTRIEGDITDYINGLDISENFYRDKIFQIVFNSDEDVENTENEVVSIEDDDYEYDGTDLYVINKAEYMDDTNNVTEITGTLNGSSGHTFVKDTDYQIIDNDGGVTGLDTIDWSLGGDDPDDGTDFFVDYDIDNDIEFTGREKADADEGISVTVV